MVWVSVQSGEPPVCSENSENVIWTGAGAVPSAFVTAREPLNLTTRGRAVDDGVLPPPTITSSVGTVPLSSLTTGAVFPSSAETVGPSPTREVSCCADTGKKANDNTARVRAERRIDFPRVLVIT